VCYYNLGDAATALDLFQLALIRQPHQPVALFNLGIVNESQGRTQQALDYYHRALQSQPPPDMAQPLTEAVKRVSDKLGKRAPPLQQ